MGLFDKLFRTTEQAITSKTGKAVGKKKTEQMLKLVATHEGREKEEMKKCPNPKLISVVWIDESGKNEIEEIEYGKTLGIKIETTEAFGTHALVIIHCENWEKDETYLFPINEGINTKTIVPSSDNREITNMTFTPKSIQAVNKDIEETKISAEVWLFTNLSPEWPINTSELIAEKIKDGYKLIAEKIGNGYELRGQKANSEFKFKTNILTNGHKTKFISLKKKRSVIVIDPGHGVSLGNVGTQARKYKYKIRGKDGKEILENKILKTEVATVNELPDYVVNNPNDWIVGKPTDNILDPDRTESFFVYDISIEMAKTLKDKGYEVIITRTIRNVKKGYTEATALSFRNDIANNNQADYFISLHCDGDGNYNTSGCHSIYYPKDEDAKFFSEALLKYYTITPKMSKHPDARSNIRVITKDNKTRYKTLIELGHFSSPKDAKNLYLNQDLIVNQLIQGLEEHIHNHF